MSRSAAVPQRVLCIRTDRLGEMLLTLPAVLAVKQALPQASVTLMAQPALEDLCRHVAGLDAVWAYPAQARGFWLAESLRLARQMRRRFDAVLVFNPTRLMHAAAGFSGIGLRAGYGRKWGFMLTHRLADEKHLGRLHEVESNMQLLRAAGMEARPAAVVFELAEEERQVERFFAQQPAADASRVVAVHPWTSHPRKQWPMERFTALVRQLGGSGCTVAIIGAAEEGRRMPHFSAENPRILDWTGHLSLPQSAALLRRCSVLVSNDSGPVHLAAAVGTPVVALFGGGDPATGPQRWGPWGGGHCVIHKASLDEISVEEVSAAVMRYAA